MSIDQLSDEALMKRVCGRDVDAFRILFGRYETRLFNFILRYTGARAMSEDLLQETFWRIWQAARTFDQTRGDFSTWMYQVALNATRSELRRKRYLAEDSSENAFAGNPGRIPESLVDRGDPVIGYERKQRLARVSDALAELSPAMREVVALRCVKEMKFHEIASMTGAPEGTIKSRFRRALAELRRRLAPGEP